MKPWDRVSLTYIAHGQLPGNCLLCEAFGWALVVEIMTAGAWVLFSLTHHAFAAAVFHLTAASSLIWLLSTVSVESPSMH